MHRPQPRGAQGLSYAHAIRSRGGRALVRLMENTTGRQHLLRRAVGYEEEIGQGRSFFDVMVDRYGLSLKVTRGSLAAIPADGPLILIANHPYGILDGLMLGHLLSRCRPDFRILAHAVFNRAPDLARHVLPVSFEETKEALALNLATRREALDLLARGGAVGIFPGGTVSTAAHPFARPLDPVWRGFTARMIAKSRATVVPVHFDGQTSRLFQIASHLHYTLRMGLLIKEFRSRIDTPVRVSLGAPLGRDRLDPLPGDSKRMMDFLRKATYDLAPEPVPPGARGFEFEQRYRTFG